MKFKALFFICAMAFAGIAFSQSSEMPTQEEVREQAMELTNEMTSTLDLTDTQVERMKGMNYSLLSHMARFNTSKASEAEKTKEMKTLKDKHQKTISQILTKEQMEKYQTNYDNLYEQGKVSFEK